MHNKLTLSYSALTALKILMVDTKYIKALKGMLAIVYIAQYAPTLLLQIPSVPICIAFFFTSGVEQYAIGILINGMSFIQYIYLLLFILISIGVIITITASMIHLLWKHYQSIHSVQYEKGSLHHSKVNNMKYAIFNVIFFMIGITFTLLLECIVHLLFIIASIFEFIGAENGRILFILGNVGSIFVVYGLLIVAIVLYSPRSFKSLQQSAEVLLEKMGKILPQKNEAELASKSQMDSPGVSVPATPSSEENLGTGAIPQEFQNTAK